MRIKEEKILELISPSDIPDGFQFVAEILGFDLAKELILKLGGMNVYIPKTTTEKIITPYIMERVKILTDAEMSCVKINQILVNETGLAYSTVKKLIRNLSN